MEQETQVVTQNYPGDSPNSVMEVRFTAYKSRWGWHAVSLEDFQLLRKLYKRYWETLREGYRWQRWFRKEPQNRAAVVPAVDPDYIRVERPVSFFVPVRTQDGEQVEACGGKTHHLDFTPRLGTVEPFYLLYSKHQPYIVHDFRRARMAVVNPEDLKPINMEFYREFFNKTLGCKAAV